MTERYTAVKEKYDKAVASIADMNSARAAAKQFISTLANVEKPLAEFSHELWGTLLRHATVYAKDDIRFAFRNGVEIKA